LKKHITDRSNNMSTTHLQPTGEQTSTSTSPVKLRAGTPEDAQACADICFDAFGAIASKHAFPSDFPTVEVALGLISMLLSHPGFYSVVAEIDGQPVGSNFLDQRGPIAGVGPITVHPEHQNRGVGRRLMQDVLAKAQNSRAPGVRLLQTAYHNRSLALYADLGFAVREPIACMQGPAIEAPAHSCRVRPANPDDAKACNGLCQAVHGHDRAGELEDAIGQGSAVVVERDGRISGYASAIAYFGHAVGHTTEDIEALLAAAPAFQGPGVLVPVRNAELFRWCLANGLRVTQLLTLMTAGLYNDPNGAYLPSILY
jgi:GNAT superfamily N-acetyltransferase